MSKKQRKKGRRRLQIQKSLSAKKPKEMRFNYLPSPFEGMSQAEVIEILQTAGDNLQTEFESLSSTLEQRILSFDPFLLLAIFSYYTLSAPAGTDPEIEQDNPILQHHVEILQAFALQHELSSFEGEPVLPHQVEELMDLLKQVALFLQMRRLAHLDVDMSEDEMYQASVLEFQRGHTQAVRNWGYPTQMLRTVKNLFAPLEEQIEEEFGVRIANLMEMFANIIRLIEDRINEHRDKFIPVFRTKSIPEAVSKYSEIIGATETSDTLLTLFHEQGAELENVFAILLSHSDIDLDTIYTLDLDYFLGAYPVEVDPAALRSIVDRWALSFGELATHTTEHFFMANPVWQKPLIHLSEDSYFLPVPALFLSFCLELAEAVIWSDDRLRQKYEKRRADFLEDEIERLFASAFPTASIYRSSLWTNPEDGREYENDALVQVDSYLIVVEAKSGRFSASARRGSVSRLKRDLGKLIVNSSIQAQRFADHLRTNPGSHRFATRRGQVNEVDYSNVGEILVLSVTLEYLELATFQDDLKRAGIIQPGVELAPTIPLSELELILVLLEGSCQKLHYLARRTELQQNMACFGDEMDFLGFYLDTTFNIGEAEYSEHPLWLWGNSKQLDPYFMQSDTGIKVEKPKIKLTQWWRDILLHIETRKLTGWTQIGISLLNVSFEEQKSFEQMFKQVRRHVKRYWQKAGHKNMAVLYYGPRERRGVLVGLAYKNVSQDERDRMMRNAATTAMSEASTTRTIVIGIDVEHGEHYPYSVMGVFYGDPLAEEHLAPHEDEA